MSGVGSSSSPDADEVLRSTTGKTNFQRVTRLLISGGTRLLRDTFDSIYPPIILPLRLNDPFVKKALKAARLTKSQWDCLYPSPGVYGKSTDFDITLLSKLLRTICLISPPPTGWDELPISTDRSLTADLVRVKFYRNSIYGHLNANMEVSDDDFQRLWKEMSEVLVRIAGNISTDKRDEWQKAINTFLKDPLIPEDERNVDELMKWYTNDMDIKKSIEELKRASQEEARSLERLEEGTSRLPRNTPRSSSSGSLSAEDFGTTATTEAILKTIVMRYLTTKQPSNLKELDGFIQYLQSVKSVLVRDKASDDGSKPKALLPEESLLKRDRKKNILRGKVKEEGVFWELTEAAAFISFPPKAVTEPMEITCSLWSPKTCSPPLDENEALVSNVIELSRDGLSGQKLGRDFNEGVTLALSHSATDLKGYEVVIQQLIDSENNEWKDLKTKNTWSESDVQSDPPLAEAKVTQCSSFAVVWRLKSFTFSSSTTSVADPVFTCIVPEYPNVSVAIPRSNLPESGDFSLTIKVQEVPCDEVKDTGVLVGPILHISSSPGVRFFKEPVTIQIPFTLREAKKEVLDLSSDGQPRILFFNCGARYPEWTEITDDLETPADVEDGVVTFQVRHLSKFSTLCSKRKRKPSSSELQHLVKKPKMPQEAGFLACLRETSPSRILMLTLFCYPIQMKEFVYRTASSRPNVLGQVQKNGFEKMCKEDRAIVSVMEQIKPLRDEDLENFSLRFLGDEPFERDILVSVQGEGEGVPKVELVIHQEDQQGGKLMCKLFFSELQTPACAQVHEQVNPSSPSDKKLKVTLLADEWGSCKGSLSTINRELAIHLAKNPRVEVTFLLPKCSDRDKEEAGQHDISIVKAEEKVGYEPQVCLSFPPADLAIEIVIGHGVELGRQAPIIRASHKCKWVQVVHTAPEELGMYQSDPSAISKAEGKHKKEVELCKQADLVVAIGPKLTEAFSCSLRSCGKDQHVFSLIPGTFMEFFDVKQASQDTRKFRVLIFGRADPEDFLLKGFDIAAQAVAELKDKTYQLLFVGAHEGKQEEVASQLTQFIPKDQLTVRGYAQTRQELKELFCEVDLAVMPSRAEGFGLTALEALSAGLPVLVSGNSGFGEALLEVQFGSPYVVKSEDASVWAKAIESVRNKTRKLRLKEVTTLREYYAEEYSWEEQCKRLEEKMWNLVDGSS